MAGVVTCMFLTALLAQAEPKEEAQDKSVQLTTSSVSIQLPPAATTQPARGKRRFTARITGPALTLLLTQRSDLLPLPFEFEPQRQAFVEALARVNMAALVEKVEPFLREKYPGKFDRDEDLIVVPVPPDKQVKLETPDLPPGWYTGPKSEVVGFLLHDVTEDDFIKVALRVMQCARQILDCGDPLFDRLSPQHYRLLAQLEVARERRRRQEAIVQERIRKEVRRRVGQALGVYDPNTGEFSGHANWVKEWRRFTYVVKDGEFIDRLKPLVEKINREIEMAGFDPPSPLDKPGIHFDKDLGDVEIVLPKPMMESFLRHADQIERRMTQDRIISIEAVRLTDREIIDGAVASRLSGVSRTVHDVDRYNTAGVIRQVGINSLLAVVNRELQIANLRAIEAGTVPEGTAPVVLPPVTLPPVTTERTGDVVGGDFSVGADDIFFDGREQSYGFSFIGADGQEHTLSLDIVDSLREFWDRIERNLIVHKIRKTDKPFVFRVPVGPDTRTFEGIAALISQENRDVVITNDQGALVQLTATAGTWLIIQDFEIEPLPGSSTALTMDERKQIEQRVLLMMFLRDPLVDVEDKLRLVEAQRREEFEGFLEELYRHHKDRPVVPGRTARTYEDVFESRREMALEDAAVEKKEKNSKIKLTFYSSQGNIIQQLGVTNLGDANDLTSFTTELRPNVVTPISSFFTKSTSGAKGVSPLTGIAKGEQSSDEKTMAHLLVRARFPTQERERHDLQEGRYIGYFDLPFDKTPHSTVNLPFLSSSEHPLRRLAQLRVGIMFDALRLDRVRKPLELVNPNSLMGAVPQDVWETAMTRLLLNRKIISDSGRANQALETEVRQRFIIEVRSLLEFDEDFFNAPNVALRNMDHWNNPDRIILALKSSPRRFALKRLTALLDDLGGKLVSHEYAEHYLARSPKSLWLRHKLYPLTDKELKTLRRDVANHYLRFQEVYGDAFMEAVSVLMNLGTYRADSRSDLERTPFRSYRDLVVFDRLTEDLANGEPYQAAHDQFMLLKQGGYKGELFQKSFQHLEDLAPAHRKYVTRGVEILKSQRMKGY